MSDHKLGVIVPYRNRPSHLDKFKEHIVNYLNENQINFELIIVEQDRIGPFNRGKLLNIGFIYAKKFGCDYVVFHDIDMLPINVDYSYYDIPLHLATNFTSKEDINKIVFDQYFGGVTLFPSFTFEKINGYSNDYWGWGFEDDDLLFRCKINNVILDKKDFEMHGGNTAALKFNGENSFVFGKNVFNFGQPFTLFISFFPNNLVYNLYKTEDIFAILGLPENGIMLYYNSYLRYGLVGNDKVKKWIYLYSDISTNYKTNLCLTNNPETREITLFQDGKKIGSTFYVKLKENKNETNFYLGTSNPMKKYEENYFRGEIASFAGFSKILSNKEIREISKNKFFGLTYSFGDYNSEKSLILYYDAKFIKNNCLIDLSGNNNDGKIVNCEIVGYSHDIIKTIDIPFRRKSSFELLKHEENGYVNNGWREKITRFNQLKFNNEVMTGAKDTKNDGLSNCIFSENSFLRNNNQTHIIVGI